MAELWTVIVVLFAILESIKPSNAEINIEDPPLSRSLGFAIKKGLDSKTLEDSRLNREFMYQYQEILKSSQDSFEKLNGQYEKRLRRVVGNHNYEMMREAGVLNPRRDSPRYESPIGLRRARTRAVRRHRLNSQSMQSHLLHSRHSDKPLEN
ncbi:uncharacterized protein LOC142981677 [Anticarsia gemmatalis]|uniref:uncharacterized protein LOC142981677 n=1 Tax=Anticarsia gemmatalis TaxID=129554 RepID=UPI003F761E5C